MAQRKKPTAPAEDVPPVAVPDLDNHPAVKLGKLAYAFIVTTVVVVVGVGVAYYNLNSKIDAQNTEIKDQAARLEALIKWLKDPTTFPGAKAINVPDEAAPPSVPSGSPAPPGSWANVSLDPPKPVVSALPSTAKALAPPVCVGKQSKRRMACEDARECWDRAAFNPNYWDKIRESVGAEQMLLCDPK